MRGAKHFEFERDILMYIDAFLDPKLFGTYPNPLVHRRLFLNLVPFKADTGSRRDFLHDEALSAEDKVLSKYLKPDLLIIDDMGMKQLPKRSGEYLFEIIMRRYETRSTMMTSNRPLEDWGKLLGDVPTATAILDRFLHHAELVSMNGRSYRLKDRPGASPEAPLDSKPAKAPPGLESDRSDSKPAKAPPGSGSSPKEVS